MEIPAFFLALAAALFGGGVSAGQWTVIEKTSVTVYSAVATVKTKRCDVLPPGKMHNAPGEPERVFS